MDTGSSRPPGDDIDREEFAEFLRTTRERRRRTLDQIADETKIGKRHLAALEQGDVKTWPGGMYRRAMMRAYAESIGLDRDVALEQFERVFEQKAEGGEERPPRAAGGPARPRFQVPRLTLPRLSRTAAALLATSAMLVVAAVATRRIDRNPAVPVEEATPAVSAAGPVAADAVLQAASTAATSGNEAGQAPAESAAAVSEGRLVVTSDPPGARVMVDGIGWGETPLTVRHLELGPKRVRLTMQGYVSAERLVTLGPERPDARVRLTLKPRTGS